MINELSNIVQGIVAEMDCTIQGEFNEDLVRTETCKTKWARVGKTVTDSNNVVFKITDLESDEYIVGETEPLTDPLTNLDGLITLNQPLFIHGTKKATNLEWTKISNNVTFKTPIIWLLGSLNFKQFGRESTLDIESGLRIFFLDETDIVNYYTADHITNVVYPMEQLVKEFIDTPSC